MPLFNPQHRVVVGGNSTSGGAGAITIGSGVMTLAGGANITVSQDGNAISIIGGAGGGGGGSFSAGMSNLGNTAGTSGSVSGQLVLVGSNNISLSQSVNGASATLSLIGNPAFSAGVSNLGNTIGQTGVSGTRLVLAGGNNITLSQATDANGATITMSGVNTVAQTVQTQNLHNVTLSGNTAGAMAQISSGTMTLAGGNNVTLSQNGNAVTISAANQTVQTQNLHNVTIAGNTAGAGAAVSSGTLTLAGGANITLSQNGNAITISGAAGGGGGFSAGVSNLGNTGGATGMTGTRLVLVGSNNITLSQTTDANGGTVSIFGGAGGGGGFSAGVSNIGQTAGSTGVTGTRLVLVGTNGMMLSQSTDANGATISFQETPGNGFGPQIMGIPANGAVGNASLALMYTALREPVTVSSVFPVVSLATNAATGSSAGASWWMGVYTRNGSTLSLASSVSSSSSWTSGTNAASNWDGVRGIRKWPIAATWQMTPGDYWIGHIFRSTNAGSYSHVLAQGSAVLDWRGQVGVHSTVTTGTQQNFMWGVGTYTVSTTGFPASIGSNEVANAPGANFRLPAMWGTNL